MISLQTNYAALVGEQNMNTNQLFQTNTIEALTSGYRINSSGDDPAGLAVANGYRDQVAELTQGVLNGNTGINTLQIIDGGLSNISTMLDRMQTLATESASNTFTGDRATLDQEFQSLKTEITRQATNIGLIAGGTSAQNLSVYVGGAPTGSNLSSAAVNVDLAGGLVDSASLGLANSTVSAGGTGTVISAPTTALTSTTSVTFAAPTSLTVYTPTASATVTLNGTATAGQFISDINQQLAQKGVTGVTADISSAGSVEFQGTAFTIDGVTAANNFWGTQGANPVQSASTYDTLASAAAPWQGTAMAGTQALTVTIGGQATTLNLAAGTTESQAVQQFNQQYNSQGLYAVADGAGISFQGTSAFSVLAAASSDGGASGITGATYASATIGTAGDPVQNATNAVTAVGNALTLLGLVQGTVGAGENKLQYAINLASSQITNFSAAESSIRDADVATEAANLSKAQVLQQASIAAMAQANAAPQAVLKLLQ
jgi:flagellin